MSQRNGDVIWRAQGVAVQRRPFVATVHDARDGMRYRGGQCIAVTDDEITVKYHAEASLIMQATVARNLKPDIRKGDPVVVEVESSGYGIAALHGGQFAGVVGPGGNQEESVDKGEFHPSRVTDEFWNL